MPTIMCGDLNSVRSSFTCHFLTDGKFPIEEITFVKKMSGCKYHQAMLKLDKDFPTFIIGKNLINKFNPKDAYEHSRLVWSIKT